MTQLDIYKSKVQKYLNHPELFNDQIFYDNMVDAFIQGMDPKKFVDLEILK